MAPGPRDYTRNTLRRLDTLSGNECAWPDCTKQLIAKKDGKTIVSKICHIEAASKKGPRYNPKMTDDDRRHISNLILMCDECHQVIDNKENEDEYPVTRLQEWKKNHESTKTYAILNDRPSLLNKAINAISDIDFETEGGGSDLKIKAFEIEVKIKFNDIKRNKALLEEYKVFHTKVNSLYKTLEKEDSFKKENLLRNIRSIYLKVKGKYVGDDKNPMRIITNNADSIIEDVQAELLVKAEKNIIQSDEDISFALDVIMVDAFMRCKILEEPPSS